MGHEIRLFCLSAGMGGVFLLIYDLLIILRKVFSVKGFTAAAADILYWGGAAVTFFCMAYRNNEGNLRAYLFTGAAMGVFLCYLTVHPFFIRAGTKILEVPVFFVKKIIKRLLFYIKRCRIYLHGRITRGFFRPKTAKKQKKRGRQVERVRRNQKGKQNRF